MADFHWLNRLFSFFRPRLRELRDIDAALAIARRIVEYQSKPDRQPAVANAQLRLLLDFLEQDLVRFIYKDGKLGADYKGARSYADSGIQPEAVASELIARLEARRRIVMARGLFPLGPLSLGGLRSFLSPGRRLSVVPDGVDPQQPFPDQSPIPQDQLKTWEAALFASLTERLFASSAVRFLGLLLAAAVLLAGTGTYFIGGQALRLQDSLQKAADQARDKLTAEAALIKAQNAELAAAQKTIDNEQREFAKLLVSAKREVDSAILDFRDRADKLKEQTSDRIVRLLERELADQTSTLRTHIEQQASSMEREITAPFTGLQAKVSAATDKLPELLIRIERLTTVSAEADRISASLTDMSRLVESAGVAARSATETVSQTEQLRTRVFQTLQPSETELLGLHQRLGGTKVRLDAVDQNLVPIEQDTGVLKKRASDLVDATATAGKTVELIRKLHDQAVQTCEALQKLRPRRTDSSLTVDEWKRIQQALAVRGFAVGKIDGKAGPLVVPTPTPPGGRKAPALSSTRQAIIKYQESIGAPSLNGELSPVQIEQLMGLQTGELDCNASSPGPATDSGRPPAAR